MESCVKKRAYKSGTKWCIWRYTEVDSGYITRLHVLKTPWWAICVHWLNTPDPEPYDHDHPVSFLSVILRGGYTEARVRKGVRGLREHRWFNFIRATPEDRHTIVAVKPKTVTLCFMGPKTREWGFASPDGWIGWQDYYAKQRAETAAMIAEAERTNGVLLRFPVNAKYRDSI